MKGNYENLKWLHYLYQVWWHASVIPATWEAKAGRSLELRGSGLQCAMPIRCLVPVTAWV
uniref:Uncharacterized protein n=1 Tax=Chelonoidis abingdonii TaxID=106734 RepID=A0A8C0G6W6_CHEAB